MKSLKFKRQTAALMAFAFVATGLYNSVMVNSDAFMDSQSVRFVKRLDEINGVVTSGRRLANAGGGEWVKLRSAPRASKALPRIAGDSVSTQASANEQMVTESLSAHAAIKEDLNLELKEVFNAKKYAQTLSAEQFSGSLTAQDGVIESLSVSLPNNESVSVVFSEMTGNVFEYEVDGQVLSGMMYQMDKNSYIVTLTNGPFEGTRLKFTAKEAVEENFGNNSEEVAENNSNYPQQENVETYAAVQNDDGTQTDVGTFGMQAEEDLGDVAQAPAAPEGGYGFSFEQSSATF